MYLHLGQDTVVRTGDVVGIFDLENSSVSKITKEFLAKSEKGGRVVNVSYELPKSFVICVEGQKSTVYITQISSTTLKKRAGFIDGISNV
ncbi:extracellular matrix regulator RemB [Anaerotruncus colihominis]|uniref:DUF370 domain-containing protein n=1 Tax=Anaerotruncus colihominis DSM 17241 TaxID=445972 RepID=B0PBN7_9FIRM|nr:extracellular matrix/biofilm biosynthesis regulator RemA family protein [Anaerotruncus colihominis]EDS11012.1 hypothetical protein ANACOL_02195 [Anaerotruncus colihominis DSM 17241]UWN75009.1 DUF370 domain-containing protein [Anaerotruncus colihominis]